MFGCGCFFYPNIREWNTQREVNEIIKEFDRNYSSGISDKKNEKDVDDDSNIIDNNTKEEDVSESTEKIDIDAEEETGQETRPYQSLYNMMVDYNDDLSKNGQNIAAAWSNGQDEIDLSKWSNISGNTSTIGYIEVPDMKIRLPLTLGASDGNLAKGAAVLNGTSMPIGGTGTNCVISAHRGWNGSAYFQYVENMKLGSKVYITNPWETLVYECVGTKVIYPDNVEDLNIQPGKDIVTLYTCHPYVIGGGPYRYLVYCERVDTQERHEAESVENPKVDEPESMSTDNVVVDDLDMQDSDGGDAEISAPTQAELEPDEAVSEPEVKSGIDLLALEQTLRVMLPVSLLAAIIISMLFRTSKPKKKKQKKKTKKKTKKRCSKNQKN